MAFFGPRRFSAKVQDVIPETIDVLCEIGNDVGSGIFGHGFSAFFKRLDQSGQRALVMEDQAVGYQMVVRDCLNHRPAGRSRPTAFRWSKPGLK